MIIDLPQAVDAAGNNHAPKILERDVANLRNYFGRYAPELLATDYGKEIWALYEAGALQPDTPLTGRFERDREGRRPRQRDAGDRRRTLRGSRPQAATPGRGIASMSWPSEAGSSPPSID